MIAHRAPASIDAEVAELAPAATVAQLRRVLSKYSFGAEPATEPGEPPAEQARRVSFGFDESGTWRLSGRAAPPHEGAVVKKALAEARDELFRAQEHGNGPHPCPADACPGPTRWWPWPRSRWPRRRSSARIVTVTSSCSTWVPTGREPMRAAAGR